MAKKIKIHLTEEEIDIGGRAGLSRVSFAIKNNLEHTHGGIKGWKDWGNSIEGALGEVAVAKYLNIPWDFEANKKGKPDVGDFYEVRTHPYHSYKMVVRDRDKDYYIYILVTGLLGKYIIHGWIKGKDARKKEYLLAPDPKRPESYYVPQHKLHDMRLLKNDKK